MVRRSTMMMVCAVIAVWLCGSVPSYSMIIVTPRDGQSFPRQPVQLVEQRIDVTLTDRAAEVSVECIYHNSTSRDLEGEWIFPLPPEAAVDKFSMFVGGEEIRAELLDAAAARNIYETIVAKTRDPALLEYVDRQLLRARIFPIVAGQDAAIKLYYTHPLTADFGVTDFAFPIVAEQWSPAAWSNETIRARSSIAIDIKTVGTLKSVTSPTHDVAIDHEDDHHATVSGNADVLRQAGDFHLLCAYDNRDITAQFLTTENEDGKFFMAIIAPGNAEGLETLPKDVVFCFDRSGSMQGEKIKQARNALKFCLNSLNPEDRFGLVWFSDQIQTHGSGLIDASDANKRDAWRQVDAVNAEGGTAIYSALVQSLDLFGGNDRPKYLVFLTDGLPTVGNTKPADILDIAFKANDHQARVFTFGVGEDLNAELLNDLAAQNNGFSSYVAPDEDVEIAVSNFFRKMSRPVLADCRLEFEPGVVINDMYPSVLHDVFAGNEIVVYGRFLNDGETNAHLHGTRGTNKTNHTFAADFSPRKGQYPFIAKLWAGRRIGYLLDAMRMSGASVEVREEIVRLSKRYGIMTPYTSFLAAPEQEMAEFRIRSLSDIPSHSRAVVLPRPQMSAAQEATTRAIESSRLQSESGVASFYGNADRAAMTPTANNESDLGKPDGTQVTISGKRFTKLHGVWTDWDVSKTAPATDTIVVKPYSEAYFKMSANKEIAAILSLGNRIIFLWNKALIWIDESGAEKWNKDWPQL